ncbi:MAG: hypothetical protein U0L70_07620 [Ruminococcus sp.]|nr:hypothetical protein [Ruminococcus sp.]
MMGSYDSMKEKLNAVGIYSIDENSNISKELSAYSEGLDSLFENLDIMTKEYFIETAENFGIERREKFLGKEKEEYSTEKRREMLMLQEQNMGGKCTPDAFCDILRSCGLTDFTFTELPTSFRLSITINDTLSPEQKKIVTERINLEFPLHLLVAINFSE